MYPILAVVYRILRAIALRHLNLSMPGFISYTELSQQYWEAEGYWVEPHGGWDEPLADGSEAAWIAMCNAVYGCAWPPELGDLPPA